MVDLTKFSKDDLKQAAKEIQKYLKKIDEQDYDPNDTTPDAEHLEDDLGGTSEKIEDEGTEETEKSVNKEDFPVDETEQMTPPSQGEMMLQILQILQEIKGKLNTPEPPEPPAPEPPLPEDEIQQSAESPTSGPGGKGEININVTKQQVEKQVLDVLKRMGLTPSSAARKPGMDSGHPIEKKNSLTYDKLKKLSWEELNNINSELNPGPYY